MDYIRKLNAYLISPVLKVTGFRFSKDYRWEITAYHRAVYFMVDTVKANRIAGLDHIRF